MMRSLLLDAVREGARLKGETVPTDEGSQRIES